MSDPTPKVPQRKVPFACSFPVYSFRHLKMAGENEQSSPNGSPQCYVAMVHVKDLPGDIPVDDTNPRNQKLSGRVPDKIRAALRENPNFIHLNRGLLISAAEASFDNRPRGKAVGTCTISFNQADAHGLVDGGHSYRIILEERDSLDFDQFVKMEILSGVEGFFTDLAEARNTSNQVQDKSLDELRDKFEDIKKAISRTGYADKVAYRENEPSDAKPVDIRDLVSYLTCFNIDLFNEVNDNHPVSAFSSKKKCLDDFRDHPIGFKALMPLAAEIFKLRDYIHFKSPEFHNEAGGKFGKLRGVEKQPTPLHFLGEDADHSVPNAYVYPILGAMRVLVHKGADGKYSWKKDPFKFFDQVGPSLVSSMVEKIRQVSNPNAVGKDKNLWKLLYLDAAMRLGR
jgi:AIPR protein